MGTGTGVAGCLVELAGGVGVNLGSGSLVSVGATWEVFVGIGVTGIVGVAARVGAAVGVAVLEGVGALVQAQDASKTDTASANARGFHCANVAPSREYLQSVKSTASYRSLRTM